MKPQLLTDCLNPEPFLKSDEWVMEEKLDGDRMIVEKRGNEVRAWSRSGERNVPETVLAVALLSEFDWTIDGELMPGGCFIAFDIIRADYAQFSRFCTLCAKAPFPIVLNADTEAEKRTLFNQIQREGREGVVFKRKASKYAPDTRNGDWQRFKFYQTETFQVGKVNIRKSSFEVFRAGKTWGQVACHMNKLPREGDNVRIKFEKFTENGKLLRARLA